jgi:hypothetical protein
MEHDIQNEHDIGNVEPNQQSGIRDQSFILTFLSYFDDEHAAARLFEDDFPRRPGRGLQEKWFG